jgi:hypothetical protein
MNTAAATPGTGIAVASRDDGTPIFTLMPVESIQSPESLACIPLIRSIAKMVEGMVPEGYAVNSNEAYENAGQDRAFVKQQLDVIAEAKARVYGPIKAHVNTLNELFGPPIATVEAAVKRLDNGMHQHTAFVEQEKRKANQIAVENSRLEKIRVENEARATAEAARREREAAEAAAEAATKPEEIMATQQALQAAEDREQAAVESVHAVESAPAVRPILPDLVELPKATNVVERKTWDAWAEIDDATTLALVIAAAAKDPTMRAFLALDWVAIRKAAKALKQHTKIPGVMVGEKRSNASKPKPRGGSVLS